MSDRQDRARQDRALARGAWAGRLTRLEDEPEIDVLKGSPGDLMALVTRLTLAGWALSKRPLPEYERARTPGRIFRPGDAE